jgi:hypothetical protein
MNDDQIHGTTSQRMVKCPKILQRFTVSKEAVADSEKDKSLDTLFTFNNSRGYYYAKINMSLFFQPIFCLDHESIYLANDRFQSKQGGEKASPKR